MLIPLSPEEYAATGADEYPLIVWWGTTKAIVSLERRTISLWYASVSFAGNYYAMHYYIVHPSRVLTDLEELLSDIDKWAGTTVNIVDIVDIVDINVTAH